MGCSLSRVAVNEGLICNNYLIGKQFAAFTSTLCFQEACGKAEMKTILAVGELSNYTNIYKTCLVAMMAGSDFIKTSTGKEAVNATLPIGLVMVRAIRDYNQATGYKVRSTSVSQEYQFKWFSFALRVLENSYTLNSYLI